MREDRIVNRVNQSVSFRVNFLSGAESVSCFSFFFFSPLQIILRVIIQLSIEKRERESFILEMNLRTERRLELCDLICLVNY